MKHAMLCTIFAAIVPFSATLASGQVTVLTEEFVDVTVLESEGWSFVNNSTPGGLVSWAEDGGSRDAAHRFQGNVDIFPASSGNPSEYIATNYNAAGNGVGEDTVSDWLITPELVISNGASLSFWTRSAVSTDPFPDRMEVRLSSSGASSDVGADPASVGDFDAVLLAINPSLVYGTYPDVWTRYQATISGQPDLTTGRIAFRYWVTDSGPVGSNGDYIGLDLVEYDLDPSGEIVFFDGFESGDTVAW